MKASSTENEDAQTDEYGADGEPCGDGAHAVVVVGRLAHAHFVGRNVDDVVLLEVVDGRVEDVFGA